MPHHLLSATDLSDSQIQALFTRANEISAGAVPNLAPAKIAVALLNQSSLLASALEAAQTAGAQLIPLAPRLTSPAEIARELNATGANLAIVSSPQTNAATEIAASLTPTLLNAGDGSNENPVRGLMDAYAIQVLKGITPNLRTAILGNLQFSGEAHSLAQFLGMFGTRLSFVSPAALSMPYDLTDQIRRTAYEVEETNDLPTTLLKTDVLYLSEINPVRVDKKTYDKWNAYYNLTPDLLTNAKPGLVILGEWANTTALLAPTHPQVEQAARSILLALLESYKL